MFLFTTPAEPRASAPATPVVDAIRQGAEQTGSSFEYLLATAQRESALDPSAKAPTSSATGLFQFIEQTWLGLMKTEGAKLGLSDLSASISARGEGGYAVADSGAREAILKLREDPRLASMMAGALTQQNREALAAATGREPTGGELYMAHLLGARGAADLIRSASQTPDRPVAADMPEAAAANRPIFFDRSGKPRSAAELYAALSNVAPAATAAPSAPRTVTATGPVALTRTGEGPSLHGMFRNDNRTGPVSDAVAKLWRVNRSTAEQKGPGIAYFPKADGGEAAVPREAESAPAASAGIAPASIAPAPIANVPLPPPRPRAAVLPASALNPQRVATTGLPR
ncbi:MAG: hypothetical protein JWQ36_2706 [Enterovirga sp.]|nr:hypothetical protein [Enterovirga sp.]